MIINISLSLFLKKISVCFSVYQHHYSAKHLTLYGGRIVFFHFFANVIIIININTLLLKKNNPYRQHKFNIF